MENLSRRRFLRVTGLGGAAIGVGSVPGFGAQARRRVVVIGGGWGGASAAKYLRLHDTSLEVTLL